MDDARTVWVGNLSDQVTEELLYELFLQAAPVERVKIPTDKEGRKSNFAFITFKHEVSVNYAQQLLNGTHLFDKPLNVRPRNVNSSDRNPLRSEFQNMHHPMVQNELGRMTQVKHHNYEHAQNNYNEIRQNRWEHNTYRDREDHHKDNHRQFKKHDYHDNRQNDSPRRRNNNYNERKHNYVDRNNRRNNYHY